MDIAQSAPEPSPRPTVYPFRQVVSRLFQYFRPYRIMLIAGVVFCILSGFCILLFPMLIGQLMNLAIQPKVDGSKMDQLYLLLCITVVALAAFSYFYVRWTNAASESALATLRQDLLKKLLHAPAGLFSQRQKGEAQNRLLADVSQIQDSYIPILLELMRAASGIIVAALLLFMLSSSIALSVSAVLIPLLVISILVGRRLHKLSLRGQDKLAEGSAIVTESLGDVPTLKALRSEPYFLRRFGSAVTGMKRHTIAAGNLRAAYTLSLVATFSLTSLVALWLGLEQLKAGTLAIGDLASFLAYTGYVGISAFSLGINFGRLQRVTGILPRIYEVLSLPAEPETATGQAPEPQAEESLSIALNQLGFHYPNLPDQPVLKHFSLHLSAGEKALLVGPNGSGKTTLLHLLLRLHEPTEGKMQLCGVPASEYTLGMWRSCFAYASSEPPMVLGTLAENIAWGMDLPDERILQAAEVAHFASSTALSGALPSDAKILPEAVFSHGERQRIGLARAVARQPKLLLLDEALDAIDEVALSTILQQLTKALPDSILLISTHYPERFQAFAQRHIAFEK